MRRGVSRHGSASGHSWTSGAEDLPQRTTPARTRRDPRVVGDRMTGVGRGDPRAGECVGTRSPSTPAQGRYGRTWQASRTGAAPLASAPFVRLCTVREERR